MYDKALKFRDSGKFRIIELTDIHIGYRHLKSENGRKKIDDSLKLMSAALDELKPDLVVFGGDIIPSFSASEDMHEMYTLLNLITKPCIDRNIPFAPVLGNHEHDAPDEVVEKLVAALEECPMSLAKNADNSISGNLNYNVPVLASDGKKTALNLWMFDSNNLVETSRGKDYDGVHRDQIEWYENQAQILKDENGGESVPAIAFEHIPVPEMYKMFREPKLHELPFAVRGHSFRKEHKYVGDETCCGYLGEGPCVSYHNSGQFESWKKTGDVVAAFFGHDHLNDVHGVVDGIILGQCKVGGFGAYTDGCRCGARVIDIDESRPRKIETFMVHFKELGLKCTCLGPVFKRISDRQSLAMHAAANVVLSVTASVAATAVVCALKKR